MSLVIFKYPLDGYEVELKLPKDFQVLSCQLQNGTPNLWVLLDNKKHLEKTVRVFACPTGMPLNPELVLNSTFAGTTVHEKEGLVWHWFYKTED